MAKVEWAKLVVAITGASSGIGEGTAKVLAARGVALALAARRRDRLDALAAECLRLGARDVFVAKTDVSEWPQQERFAAASRKRLGPAHIVIANAGYGQIGNTLDTSPQDVQKLFQTNTVGAIWTIQAFGDQLEETAGHAIVVGSVVSKVAVPYSSVYAASKWALRGWTRGARPELESRGIDLTLFNPGYVRTEFFQSRRMTEGVQLWNPGRGMTPEQVGRRMLRAIRRRPAEMEMTLLSRIAIPVYRLMPIRSPRMMARKVRDRADSRYVARASGKAEKKG